MDNFKERKRGKDKQKNTFNKYGKYTNKSIRIRQEVTANQEVKKKAKNKN